MIDWLRREVLEPNIELDGKRIPITLKRNLRARRLTLRLSADGKSVNITLPQWARSREAIAFAHARRDWLTAQLVKLPERITPEPSGTIYYRGQPFTINWAQDLPRNPKIKDATIKVGGPLNLLERRLARWLQGEALALFQNDMQHYCALVGFQTAQVSLSRARKRWGSCSDRKNIRLNWRLVQAPDLVRRSVVAHEVAHLEHFDHSPAFYSLLKEIYEDDIDTADRWLKRHGRKLYINFD